MTRNWHLVSFIILLLAMRSAAAEEQANAITDADADKLAFQVRSHEAGERDAAVKEIERLIRADPVGMKDHMIRQWWQPLHDFHYYEQINSFNRILIAAVAYDTPAVETLQLQRANAIYHLGLWEHALFAAKGAFNVCRLDQNDRAVRMLTGFLDVASRKGTRRSDPTIAQRFKLELQLSGEPTTSPAPADTAATTATTQPTTTPATVLSTIRYRGSFGFIGGGLKKFAGSDYQSLLARGNLYLLQDEVKQARKLFEKAYEVADDEHRDEALENLARVMKAEDGSALRAAKWLEEHRAKVHQDVPATSTAVAPESK